MSHILGIDISYWQGWKRGIPFTMMTKLHQAGVRFVIARASVGNAPDVTFDEHRKRVSKRKTWVFGAYHFLDDSVDGVTQADAFVNRLRQTGGTEGIICALDVEVVKDNDPKVSQVKTFVKRFRERCPKVPLGLYTNQSSMSSMGNPDFEEIFDWLWQARWIGGQRPPVELPPAPPRAGFAGFRKTTIWQWGMLHVGGHGMDGDAFYGTMEELRNLARAEKPPVQERPAYIAEYNDNIEQYKAEVKSIPIDGIGILGLADADAREDALEELQKLMLTTP